MQLPRIGRKWLARPGIYLAGASMLGMLALAACSGDKPASMPNTNYDKPAATATATPYPTATPPAATAIATPNQPPTQSPVDNVYRPLVDVDGRYDPEEWKGASSIDIQGGKLLYKNDNRFLYLLLDVTQDTGDDPPAEGSFPAADGFSIAFDVDNNGRGTPMRDVKYTPPRGTYDLGKQILLQDSPLGWSAVGPTDSKLGVGFGETDASTPHRYWVLIVNLEELGIRPEPGSSHEMAAMVYLWSNNPRFYIVPPNQSSFENLPKLRLAF